MPDKAAQKPEFMPPVRLNSLHLQSLRLERTGGAEMVDSTELPMGFHLGVARVGESAAGVELQVEVAIENVITLTATYRGVFVVEEPLTERLFREIVTRLGPMVLYPYLRNAINQAAAQAGVSNFHLPIVNVGGIFPPEDIDLPPWPPTEKGGEDEDSSALAASIPDED